ncbi:lactate/malate family dehydrogenase [Celerinatantimonas diazotrophica]|uniref:Malate dehydrogenase (NAD) n=1 Tax=Celerinatantimonas diazotrophica TaxID=412034 RepID=A0A4R1K1G5_9GAMM|nr:L-lactate dehydrogenase [Celerinatantimonas diazotrophica]TCK57815.1 malate dehydrogenase (NAD) [Celerinatantimonas diazotrophica]CAG9298121.1 L-2-hydroxyisocaproate dehydrogenase [Celerinatantimonas diazotrophica]
MSRHVSIIGCGHVGADVAFSLASQNLADHISLFDKKEEKAFSEMLELKDMSSLIHSHVRFDCNDESQLATTDIIVVAVGPKATEKTDRLNEVFETSQAVAQWVPKIKAAHFDGVVINITNPCDVITAHLAKLLALPQGRVFGTGTSLDSARMRRVVADTLGVATASVDGYVMGEHGESQFVPWSTIRVGGIPFTQWPAASGVDLMALEQQVRHGGWDILAGKGWTSFGIASATARLVDAVFSDAHSVFAVSAFDETLQTQIGQPAIIAAQGVVQPVPVELTDQERQRFADSAAVIKKAFASIA